MEQNETKMQIVTDPQEGHFYMISGMKYTRKWRLLHRWQRDCIMLEDKSGKRMLAQVVDLREPTPQDQDD